MSTYRLTVNDNRFYLPSGEDVSTVKTALLNAVNSGGGFVDVVNSSCKRVTLLVTPHSTVQIEEFGRVDDIEELWQQPPASSSFNFDEYDLGTALS